MNCTDEYIAKAKDIVKNSTAILITAGAGMGVDSGLPDFRGDEGFWKAYPPMKKLNISFSQMANPTWFYSDPSFAWGFYGHRLNLYRETIPHKGFEMLLEIASDKPDGYFVYTSNVDGQFQKAGFSEDRIVECHGSIHMTQCLQRCGAPMWINIDTPYIDSEFRAKAPLPSCPSCGGVARPNILMFGDYGWDHSRSDAQEDRFQEWLKELQIKNAKLAIIEVGAGVTIPTIQIIGEDIASRLNATLIRINPKDYDVPNGNIGIALGGLEGIERVCARH